LSKTKIVSDKLSEISKNTSKKVNNATEPKFTRLWRAIAQGE